MDKRTNKKSIRQSKVETKLIIGLVVVFSLGILFGSLLDSSINGYLIKGSGELVISSTGEVCAKRLLKTLYEEDGSKVTYCLTAKELALVRCEVNEDCDYNEECMEGFCTTVVDIEMITCTTIADCPSFMRCYRSYCVPA